MLMAGLVLFGLSLAVFVQAGLGVDPWTVFQQGLAERTGLSLGTATIVTSLAVLATWIPLGEKMGLGTVANALVVGPVIDLGLTLVPEAEPLGLQLAFAVAAILGTAIATGLYVGAGWGPGPRDGLMTGLHKRGVPIAWARTGIEATVLVVGWLLGGTVGIATVLFALSIGALVRRAMARLALPPAPSQAPRAQEPAPGAEPAPARR
jgi:uncharacterized membrane protein YczE